MPKAQAEAVAITVANDLHDILAVIISNISLTLGLKGNQDRTQHILAEAKKAALTARDLVYQLSTLTRGGPPVLNRADLTEIIKKSASPLCGWDSQDRCEPSVADGLWPVQVDTEQISQVIQFLVTYLAKGLPYGAVQIKAENVVLNNGNGIPLCPGNYVLISIEQQGPDSRPGSPADIPDYRGMGFGAIYRRIENILQQHGGRITADSAAGAGASFRLYLPADKKVFGELQESSSKRAGARGRILVMDDDEMILNNVGNILNVLGYETELAKDGFQALEMFGRARNSGSPFDAVIIDITVRNGMGGAETFQKLLEMDPETKGILFSGHAEDVIASYFQNLGFRAIIRKPYEIKDFNDVLDQVLN